MKRVLLTLIILIIAAVLGICLSHSPGYIYISFYHWSVETTFLTGTILIVLLYIIVKGFLLALSSLIHIPEEIKHIIVNRRKKKSNTLLDEGIKAYGMGDWNNASRLMQKSLKNPQELLLSYILLAESANNSDNFTKRDNLIYEAIQLLPTEKSVLQLLHIRLCIDKGQWKCALEILYPLWKANIYPSLQALILKYLVVTYENQGNWFELIVLLPKVRHYKIFSKTELNQFSETVYVNAFTSLLVNEKFAEIDEFILTVPRYIKKCNQWTTEYNKYLNKNS